MYKLLIADDEPIERSTLALIVSRSFDNIEVLGEASNGREAIAKALELKPDIVFMDIKMPGVNGIDAAQAIKAANKDTKIIIVTAYDYFDYAKESLKIGIDDFLLKPVLKEDLQESLNRIINKIKIEENQKQFDENVTRRLKELSTYLERELISSILLNLDVEQIQNYFNMLDLKFDQAFGIIASINETQVPAYITDGARRKVLNKRVYDKVLKNFTNLGVKFISGELNNWLYILILLVGEDSEYNRKLFSLNLVSKIKEYVKRELETELYCGIGNVYVSAEKLYDSFLEAKIAHDNNTDNSEGMHFSDTDIMINYMEYPFNEEKNLCERIVKGQLEESATSAKKLLAWVEANCESINRIHEKLFEIVVIITRTAAVFEHIDSKFLNTARYWDEIRSIQSVNEMHTYMYRVIREIVSGINNVRNLNMNDKISHAAEFIKNNYDKDISLEDVAKAVSLSPYYFSKLFKTVTGENFIDYLTRYRMSLAESLLKEGCSNIKEICYKTGYNDPNYFSKLFKKYYNMNPSEYKDSIKK